MSERLDVSFDPAVMSIKIDPASINIKPKGSVLREQPDPYTGAYSVTPSESAQTLETSGLLMQGDVEVGAIPSDYVGSAVPTKEARTITPAKGITQYVRAGNYLLGDQTINPIPDSFYDMSDPMSWLGKEVTQIQLSGLTKSGKLKDTLFNGWTPATTAKTIVSGVNANTFTANLDEYEYYLVWDCACDMEYTGSPTLKAHMLFSRAYLVQQITKRPSTFQNIQANNFDGNACTSLYTSNFLRYYGTTTGTLTYSWSVSYGIYFSATAATFSNSTADSVTVTVKTPAVSARCSTTYFSTGNAALVDQDKSEYSISGKLYKVKKNAIVRNIYDHVVALINE